MIIIERKIDHLLAHKDTDLRTALQRINENQRQYLLVVDDRGALVGVMTDGDVRRWLLLQEQPNLSHPVEKMMNPEFTYSYLTSDVTNLVHHFRPGITFVPLTDDHGRPVALARPRADVVKIDQRAVGEGESVFVIAEIGNNHNGDMDMAKRLIDSAAASGADCAKFQIRDLSMLYANRGKAGDAKEDLGSQYVLDLLTRFNLDAEQLFTLFDYCKEKGIVPMCTPFDVASLQRLEEYGMGGYKIGSPDFTNHDMLLAAAKTGKPLLCSTGMSTEIEIRSSVELLRQHGSEFILLHCNSTYPSPYHDLNLRYISALRAIGNCPVGYSGHERGYHVPLAAVALGAKVIEKHFTLDRNLEGNDHRVSLLPGEFKDMVNAIRDVEAALGSGQKNTLSQGELLNREVLGKSVVVKSALAVGDVFTEEVLDVRSPGKGLAPYRKKDVVGKVARRAFAPGDIVYPTDILEEGSGKREFHFRRPWGLPIRYHDVAHFVAETNMDVAEFHFSYRDLEESPDTYFSKPLGIDFLVHAPELFASDHILDLACPDSAYREQSIVYLQEVVNVTRSLQKYFPKTKRPRIIVNVGGATQDAPLSPGERTAAYERVVDSLKRVDTEGVEIVPQTMPPYPWHFGGQRFHNLFIDAEEIAWFCSTFGYRVCFDVAHSKLASNERRQSFKTFLAVVAPFAAHYHISDARGLDGEGLQVQEGEIDFSVLAETMDKHSPGISFIPEIWQGHKDHGRGFWLALELLEKWL